MPQSDSSAKPLLSPLVIILLIAAGVVLIGAGAFLATEEFFPSYLIGFVYWAEIAIGCLGILLVSLLIRSRWGAAVQRPALAGGFTLIVLAVLFVPLLFGLDALYPWRAADYPELAHLPPDSLHYLSTAFWIVRSVVAFVVWIGLTFLLSGALSRYDESGEEKYHRRARNTAGLGAVLFVLAGAFVASVDWIMSLDPYWFSSIYGWLAIARQGMVGIAFLIVLLTLLVRNEQVARVVNQRVVYDLSMLQLGMVMAWGYMHFFQYIIMWHGNLPKEAAWFVPRTTGGWEFFAIFLIVANLLFPLVMLMIPVKKTLPYLSIVSVVILIAHWVEVTWLIRPSFSPTFTLHWLDLVLPVAVGAIWLAGYFWFLGRERLVPIHHPVLDELVGDGEFTRSELETATPASG